jgi:cytochrome c oxidase subunit 2
MWRVGSLLVNAVVSLLQAQPSALPEHRIADIFKPLAGPAEAEKTIALLSFVITGIIFVVVAGLIVFTVLKFRRKAGETQLQEPPQVYGSNQIEVAWTVIPILIVFILIGVSARVIASVENASPPNNNMTKVTLIGHQWWWEVKYPDYGIVTANEIHVPSLPDGAAATYIELQSMDVIHSFWLPQLAGKTDLIPNRSNYTWINPKEPGVYFGNCAEYCGTQHANMLLRVIAQTPADFKKWTLDQQKDAAAAAQMTPDRQAFESLSCVNCHAVKGTSSIGKFGPDLTHLMSRQTLGAGVIDNTPANLRIWVNDPQDPKPGCFMPSLKLTDAELTQVLNYLGTLK